MDGHAIRTPDHRLRVFISSTLGELAEERLAARAAVDLDRGFRRGGSTTHARSAPLRSRR